MRPAFKDYLLASLGQNGILGTALAPEPAYAPSPLVTRDLKRQFVRDGFIVVPGGVQKELRDAAVAAIANSLSREASTGASPALPIPKVLTMCPELTTTRPILDLMVQSQALGCVQALIGARANKPFFGQIALRNPGQGCLPAALASQPLVRMFLGLEGGRADRQPMPHWEKFWHIDGWPSALNRVQQVSNFTVLVGVMLSDAVVPNCGNLTVYPGSHHVIEQVLQESGGPEAVFTSSAHNAPPSLGGGRRRQMQPGGAQLPKPGAVAGATGDFAARAAMADGQVRATDELRRRVHSRLGKPVQVRARAGDVVIAHYQLAHCIAPNTTDNVRKCVYFRFTHSRRQARSYCPAAMTNIWLEFDGLADVLRAEGAVAAATATAERRALPACREPTAFTPAARPPALPGPAAAPAHPAAAAAGNNTHAVQVGVSALERGAALQAHGRPVEALPLYMQGVGTLLGVLQGGCASTLSEHRRQHLRDVVAQFLSRAEAIKKSLRQ